MPEQSSGNQGQNRRGALSVAMVACNEEANIARTLASVIDAAERNHSG